MPASASSLIDSVRAHAGGGGSADLAAAVPGCWTPSRWSLTRWLAGGVRHPLVTVLAVSVCAVLAGARSMTAIGEWVADLPRTGP